MKYLKSSQEFESIKTDRKNILDHIEHNDWNIVLRKLSKIKFSDFRHKFEDALENIKVSLDFINEYKDLKLFPSVIHHVLKNKDYSENELIEIIEKFPEYINWYDVFYNKNIPIWYKKQNYDKIHKDMLNSFDINVSMDIRKKNTEKELSILK